MNVVLKEHPNKTLDQISVIQEIETHTAWHGHISGLEAEKLLRGRKTPYLFILRSGEYEGDYYVTFITSDMSIKHQPFVISTTIEAWYFQNGGSGGPFTTTCFDDVLHLIMHCRKVEPTPKTSISCVHDSTNC